MHLTQDLELFPEYSVTQFLFKDVTNSSELRKMAIEGQISCALINPSMILDTFQTLVAANKAVHLQNIGKMKTKTLYSEIIFSLSPTNNISEAFKRFGTSDNDKAVLIILVHKKEEDINKDHILSKVKGEQIPPDDISSLSDIAKIKKLYKVTPQEEKCGSVLDAVVCRMATKDAL